MDKLFETKMKQLRTQTIMEHLIKWKNLPIEDSTWEDSFIEKRQQLIKHWGQRLSKGEGMLSLKWGALPPKLGALAPNCVTLHDYCYY